MSKRVAISIRSLDGLDAFLDPRFGRAHGFVIVDSDTGEIAAQFFNNAASAAHGAGTAAAVTMKNNDVVAVISGRFGPKAVQSLSAYGIDMWIAKDNITAKEALDSLRAGNLEQMKMKVY